MGAAEPVVERESERREEEEKEEEVNERKEEGGDVEKGEVLGVQEKVIDSGNFDVNNQFGGSHVAMMQRLNPTNPLRIVIGGSSRMPTPSPSQTSLPRSAPIPQTSLPRSAPIPQGIQGLIEASESFKRKERRILKFYLPQVETASLLSITLAFVWQKAVRQWPRIMVPFILWSSFILSLSAGILLICFQRASTDGVGVCLIAFAIGNGLYACWVTQRIGFCTEILIKSLEPVPKFGDLNQPTYWMLGVGFLWMSLWILAVIGAMNFYLTPLVISVLVLSLAWTAEVMRNIVNLTVSRVIALYYLRGMQSIPQNCFQRAFTQNLGSACLGSLFVPTIEALRVVVRGLNLLEGEDEFMFSCAHCCLNVMQSIFRYGNSWAFVQVATYGKGFVQASQDTWQLFVRQGMESIVDSDITSSICFLTGVCSGSICVIVVAAWTARVHQTFTATLSLLSFFIGYLMVGSSYLTNSILYLLDLVFRSCDQLGHSIIYTKESFFNQEAD
ncbi:hypothetical protein H0E87_017727 [Populus deltoides]|uniref:Choline transporter-like protein n=1 Tax=Populus deltoides TaxID=3696 RepID=A0A8T2Y1F4_POPDE|nr:hypothetical protein H0E87_017727 [Populus deltoides]